MRFQVRHHAVAALLAQAAVVFPSAALAMVPAGFTEQGRLFDDTGNPLSTTVSMVFSVYPVASGGTAMWTETQPAVTLQDGYFSVELGSVNPLPESISGAVFYVGVAVNSDPEMTPRQPMYSVPYALVTNDAIGDIHPTTVSVNGSVVINASGTWVGPSTGLVGPAGPAGAPGATGATGSSGAQGAAGATGTAGPAGSAGPQGPQGPIGATGAAGAAGAQGAAGASGAQGAIGATGATGPAGAQGAQGATGNANVSGTAGEIAYYTGTNVLGGNGGLTYNAATGTLIDAGTTTGGAGLLQAYNGSSIAGSTAVTGVASASSGATYGVFGQNDSSTAGAAAVYGVAGGAAAVYGVQGVTNSLTLNAAGVRGTATGVIGATYGVYGSTASTATNTAGVLGVATATTGQTYGLFGQTFSTGTYAAGVIGGALASTGYTYGVYGATYSTYEGAAGLYGQAMASTGATYGVYAFTSSTTDGAAGVFGSDSGAPSGQTYGVYGFTGSASGVGVYGFAGVGEGASNGVDGVTTSGDGFGGLFANYGTEGTGVCGIADGLASHSPTGGAGGAFVAQTIGVAGYSVVSGTTQTAGGYFATTTGGYYAYTSLYNGTNYKILGTGTVSTIVRSSADPAGKTWVTMHATETPEILLEDYGEGQLVNGAAHVSLDDTFAGNVTINERHHLRVYVQLEDDAWGEGVTVTNKTAHGFDVVERKGGTSNLTFQWHAVANRSDEVASDGLSVSRNADLRFEPAPARPETVIGERREPNLPRPSPPRPGARASTVPTP